MPSPHPAVIQRFRPPAPLERKSPAPRAAAAKGPLKTSRVALSLALYLLISSGCAVRNMPEDPAPRDQPRLAHMRDVSDLRRFPQDLTVYAKALGERKVLLSEAEQDRQRARFERIFFSPWNRDMTPAPATELAARFGKGPRGFTEDAQRWSRQDWEAVRDNANLSSYPLLGLPGITLRRTSMRELPTTRARMSSARAYGPDNPFDMFQYSALPLGTPLHIAHRTTDGRWFFAQSPIASGWISATDAAPVDEPFITAYRCGRYAAIIKDDLPVGDGSSGKAHVGEIYPLRREGSRKLTLLMPRRDARGRVALAEMSFARTQAAPWPLPLNPAWLAAVGNQMMGQPYGWGGLAEGRDCSSTLRDLFAPFGVWLPRNSAAQGKTGRPLPLEGLSAMEKDRMIAESATPFMSLLWMRGHIMLYLGRYQNENLVFHNVWGLRITEDGNEDARHVIGRGVVSSLRLGAELPAVKEGARLLERLRGIAVLPPE